MSRTAAAGLADSSFAGAGLWRLAQAAGVALTLLLLAGLLLRPDLTLRILWNGVVPLLPAVFLVQPEIWRNVCPLATLNVASGRRVGRRANSATVSRALGSVGLVLLLVLVPARRFLFNTDGPALALTIAAVAVLALALGFAFDMKAGFCNTLCPVLPVERLYGQRPLLRLPNARCRPCTLCTRKGCLDLVPAKSVKQTLGVHSRSGRWLRTPYGAFAAAFPGFVIGYYTTSDVALSAAWSVYGHIGLWMLGSYAVIAAAALILRVPGEVATVPIAALAFGLYYWFAASVVVESLGLAGWVTPAVRVAAAALIVLWLWRGGLSLTRRRVKLPSSGGGSSA
jgi:hypothetical protein